MTQSQRPLSPHLQIYRWELTMALSILHRVSGLLLSLGALFLVCWLLAAAAGPARFAAVHGFVASTTGQVLLFAWTLALFFHLGNGIRHLFWDVGYGFSMPAARRSAWFVLVFSVAATLLAWYWGLGWGTAA